jgi:hypothetical protein
MLHAPFALTPRNWSRVVTRAPVVGEWLLLAVLAWQFADFVDRAIVRLDLPLVDFRVFYAGGRQFAQGMSPYEVRSVVNPPWFSLLMAPLAVLPYELAARCWLILTLALLGANVVLAARLCHLRLGPSRTAILFLALPLWYPVADHLVNGQSSVLAAAGALGAVLAADRGRPWLAGLLLAVAAVKPQLMFLLGPGLALWCWGRYRSVGVLAGGALGIVAAVAICLAITPAWVGQLLERQPEPWHYWLVATTTRTLLAKLSNGSPVSEGLYLLLLVVGSGAVLLRWARPQPADTPAELAGLTLATTLLLTPYAHTYDYFVLLLPLMLVGARISRASTWWKLLLVAALALGIQAIMSAEVWMLGWLSDHWGTAVELAGEDRVAYVWEELRSYNSGRFFVMLVPLALLPFLTRLRDRRATVSQLGRR